MTSAPSDDAGAMYTWLGIANNLSRNQTLPLTHELSLKWNKSVKAELGFPLINPSRFESIERLGHPCRRPEHWTPTPLPVSSAGVVGVSPELGRFPKSDDGADDRARNCTKSWEVSSQEKSLSSFANARSNRSRIQGKFTDSCTVTGHGFTNSVNYFGVFYTF